jgi:hypothetical protein
MRNLSSAEVRDMQLNIEELNLRWYLNRPFPQIKAVLFNISSYIANLNFTRNLLHFDPASSHLLRVNQREVMH